MIHERVYKLEQLVAELTLRIAELERPRFASLLENAPGPNAPREMTVICNRICIDFKMPAAQLFGRRRDDETVWPRHLAMYLVRQCTTLSLSDIGRLFFRDHSAIHHAIVTVEDRAATDPQKRKQLDHYMHLFAAELSEILEQNKQQKT